MRYVRLFENHIDSEFYQEVVSALPGNCEISFSRDRKPFVFGFFPEKHRLWREYGKKKLDSSEIIDWCTENVDDIMFGEDDEEIAESKRRKGGFEIDLEKSRNFLSEAIDILRKHGLFIERAMGLVELNEYLGVGKKPPLIIFILKEDPELKTKYRGRIAGKITGF